MNGKQQKHNEVAIEYRFADFKISRSQQVLMQGNEKIVIGTKAYYLLLTFLENHGHILKKDDIINAVWPGQIVTDTALTKQIVRLRRLIGDQDGENPMIETHRGVGYRFAIPVESREVAHSATLIKPERTKSLLKVKWVIAIFALFSLIYLISQTNLADSSKEIKTFYAGVGLAIIPTSNKQDWLNRGGLNYLSQVLEKNRLIYTIKPRPEWYQKIETDKLAVEISSHNKINYALLVGIDKTENQLTADVKLRTLKQVIAKDELRANNISELMMKINNWVGKNLLADKKINEFYLENPLSKDNYAMESYLQGVYYQEFNNDKKANEFYQVAVNKDKDFIQAWIQLADTEQRMGQTKKAISIAENTLLKFKKNLDIKQLIKLNYIIGYAYYFQRDYEKAKSFLSKSTQYITETENPLIKMTAYDALGGLAFMQQNWQKSEEYTLARIAIAKDYYPFPNYMAAMDLILAETYGMELKLEQSKSHLYSAIEYYEKVNDAKGMIRALVSLLTIDLFQSQYDEGVALINKSGIYLENVNNPHMAFMFMEKAIYILNLRGYFNQSNAYLHKMYEIAAQTGNPMNQLSIEQLNIHKYYVQDNFIQAKNHVDAMGKLYDTQPALLPSKPLYYLVDLLISSRLNTGTDAYEKYQKYIKEQPNLKDSDTSAMLERALGHIYINLGNIQKGMDYLKQAEELNLKKKDLYSANYIAFEILEIMLMHPEMDYKVTMARLSSRTSYDYKFFKLKAQFMAREGDFFNAAILMSENKQKANQLWTASDQLLLEDYQIKSK